MSKYHNMCFMSLLGSLLALPTLAIEDGQRAATHSQSDIVAMRSELQALEASVARLENRLASIETQQRVPAKNGALSGQRGSTAAQDLEKAIQALLQDVTEQ